MHGKVFDSWSSVKKYLNAIQYSEVVTQNIELYEYRQNFKKVYSRRFVWVTSSFKKYMIIRSPFEIINVLYCIIMSYLMIKFGYA